MSASAAGWEELDRAAAGAGTARRRLLPASPHDLFLAVRHPERRRMLTMGLHRATAVETLGRRLDRLSPTAGLDLRIAHHADRTRELQLSLLDTTLVEVFNVLVDDVALSVQTAAPGPAVAFTLVDRVERWVAMLRAVGQDGLEPQQRRGLFGELHILERLRGSGVDQVDAVSAWTGPHDTAQDFQLDGVAIEVKTTSTRNPSTLTITSERQLDETGCGRLLLAHIALDERRGGTGTSLNDLVGSLRTQLTSASARTRLDDLLVRAGRLPHHLHLYDEPRYTVRGETVWEVADGFPRLTEADLRPGVGSCTYRISTHGLDGYVVGEPDFVALVTGAGHG